MITVGEAYRPAPDGVLSVVDGWTDLIYEIVEE